MVGGCGGVGRRGELGFGSGRSADSILFILGECELSEEIGLQGRGRRGVGL